MVTEKVDFIRNEDFLLGQVLKLFGPGKSRK